MAIDGQGRLGSPSTDNHGDCVHWPDAVAAGGEIMPNETTVINVDATPYEATITRSVTGNTGFEVKCRNTDMHDAVQIALGAYRELKYELKDELEPKKKEK